MLREDCIVGFLIFWIIVAVIALLLGASNKNADSNKIENLEKTLRNKNQEIELNEFRKKEILRELQAPKSLDLRSEIGVETFQGENYLIQQMFINSRISKQENNTNEISQQITRSKNNDI